MPFYVEFHVDPSFISCIVVVIMKLRDSFRDKLTNLFLILGWDAFLKSWFLLRKFTSLIEANEVLFSNFVFKPLTNQSYDSNKYLG